MTALTDFYPAVMKDIAADPDLALLEIRGAADEFLRRSSVWRKTLPPKPWQAVEVTLTPGNPTTCICVGHGLASGQQVLFDRIWGDWRALAGYLFPITVVDGDTFSIDVDSGTWTTISGALASVAVYDIPATMIANTVVCEVYGAESSASVYAGTHPLFSQGATGQGQIGIVTPDALDVNRPGWRRETGLPRWITGMDETAVRFVPAPFQAAPVAWALLVALTITEDATDIPDDIYARWKDTIAAGARMRLRQQSNKPWSSPDLFLLEQAKFEDGVYKAGARARKGFTKAMVFANPVGYGGLW